MQLVDPEKTDFSCRIQNRRAIRTLGRQDRLSILLRVEGLCRQKRHTRAFSLDLRASQPIEPLIFSGLEGSSLDRDRRRLQPMSIYKITLSKAIVGGNQ